MPFGGLGDVRLDGPPLQLAALSACLQLAALALGRPHPDVQKDCCTHGQPAGLSGFGVGWRSKVSRKAEILTPELPAHDRTIRPR